MQAKNKRFHLPFVCSNHLPNLQGGAAIPQFCIIIYANYTILATQRRGMAQCPSPSKYAPVNNLNNAFANTPRLFAKDTCLQVKGLNPEQYVIQN